LLSLTTSAVRQTAWSGGKNLAARILHEEAAWTDIAAQANAVLTLFGLGFAEHRYRSAANGTLLVPWAGTCAA
jgi:hypothetical protein